MRCGGCGGATVEERGDYWDLGGPEVAIREIPALLCRGCGACYLPGEVMRRLGMILDEALELAEMQGLRVIDWAYTRTGPADLGALPSEVREFFGGCRDPLDRERRLAEATERAGIETPAAFH